MVSAGEGEEEELPIRQRTRFEPVTALEMARLELRSDDPTEPTTPNENFIESNRFR